jgi:eukaryotic-like serine/threonine-protein kinase
VLSPGTRIGPYEIEAPLGSGGAGHVFRARDTRLGRAVAIKVLTTSVAADAAALRDRLQREARAISQLAHPHICTLYDIGVTPDGVSFLVMELLEGETLEQTLARGPLPLAQAMTYAAEIAGAVGAAHRAGIVHGDLKPGNVMVTKGGVKLLDFGLATERAPVMAATPDQVTRTTAVGPNTAITGTLQYLAPEQIEGRPSDERGDIFACGAVIFEMVSGRKAFPGQTAAAVIAAILREDPPPLTQTRQGVPPSLERLVSACLVKDPAERWQNASDLARELRWLEGRPDSTPLAPPSPSGRLVWVAGAAALLLTMAVILLAREYLRPPPAEAALARSSVMLPPGLQFPAGSTLGGVGRFAISPDGKRLVFVGVDDVGNQMLWLRPLDSLTASPIAGTAGGSSPFWSPDSQSIAFFAQGQLKAVSLSGGDTRVVASRAYNATGAWNDDTILFTPTATSGIARVPAGGGTVRPVTMLDAKAGDVVHRSPSFLPDGRHFLYVAVAARPGGTTPRAIYVGSIDGEPGAQARLVLESGSSVKYADGHLVFLRENTLVAQAFDPERLSLTGEPRTIAEQVELTGVASATFALSATGALVYQTVSGGSQLEWVDRQGRVLETVGEPGHYGDLELSPDARQVAVSVLNPATNTRDIWVMDLARGVRTRLTADRAEDVAPVWSPDGLRIAFASNRTGHFDLYQKAANGIGDDQLLVGNQGENYPTSWGGDGSLLIWTFAGPNTGLMKLGPSGTTVERWLGGGASQATLSRDGRWALYASPESGRLEVNITDYPAHAFRMQVSIAGGTAPRWRADGREVFYTGRDNKLMAVAITPRGSRVDVEEAKPLFDIRPVGRGFFYAPAPDGQRFLVNALREPGAAAALTLVQNWRAALQP